MHDHRRNESDGSLVPCASDDEKNCERLRWRKVLADILPASFRIGKDVPDYYAERLTHELTQLLEEASNYVQEEQGEASKPAAAASDAYDPRAPLAAGCTTLAKLPFLPNAYQLSLDRATIRKNPALTKLHEWLKHTVGAGDITRQETVSMIPPVLLQVQPDEDVLDMCAAPGSKTTQLLEHMTGGTGVLVANDSNAKRAYMLVHQLRRVLSNHPVALVTACPAQFFPSRLTQFDKILCDVPCSGDGTTRKNIGVWKSWSSAGSVSLHALQVAIACKGAAELLRVGGTMCYSTCSFNPIENEAVVAEILRQGKGALELVENTAAGLLGDFRTRPGLNEWKVLVERKSRREMKNEAKKQNPKMQAKRKAYAEQQKKEGADTNAADTAGGEVKGDSAPSTAEEETTKKMGDEEEPTAAIEAVPSEQTTKQDSATEKFEPTSWDVATLLEMASAKCDLEYYKTADDVPANLTKRIKSSLFSPTSTEQSKFHLERCIRCLSHDNDTGGFFVALIRKTAPMSRNDRRHEGKEQQTDGDDAATADGEPEAKRARTEETDAVAAEPDKNAKEEEEESEEIRGQIKGNLVKGESVGKDDFADISDEITKPLIDFYGLTEGFDTSLYMARASSKSKVIYYIGKPVKRLFDLGIQEKVTSTYSVALVAFENVRFTVAQPFATSSLYSQPFRSVINSGLKGFMRNSRISDGGSEYRICQEGVHFLAPFMTKRKLTVGLKDFRTGISGGGKTIHFSEFSEEWQAQVKDLELGSFVVILKEDPRLIATLWKCRGDSVDGLVGKVELEGIMGKLAAIEKENASANEAK